MRELVKEKRLATDRIALTSEIRKVNDKLAGELADIRTQSDLAQQQFDLLMEEIERGAAKEHAAGEAEKKATEAAIRAKRGTDLVAAAEVARKAEEAKLIEPATTAHAALLEIADRIEQRGTERVRSRGRRRPSSPMQWPAWGSQGACMARVEVTVY